MCPLALTFNCFHCLDDKFQRSNLVSIPCCSVYSFHHPLPHTHPPTSLVYSYPRTHFTPLCHPPCCCFLNVLMPPTLSFKTLLSL